ncbi:MAG: cytidylate kinase [Candidatus Fluviicola riflensis]|nr:MAG: cytidylate kinase [Candidatus Fluviicola riflensis]OGS76077.1 MAG: cytidylate kinase [Candidatus Fluviicola riflensis]OGS81977.1 MAG: cytidylate kinase [Fluviicola sp. RIFCSPHIGHO2_01_FULL_43_53]OGS83415.1 MAG: cytidylate kinase [Fluviicola sp. RIFCSPHIGHO2_12_FULL_43_24]
MSELKKKITIAIDGYSSCGKSTLAKALAHTLQYVFVDSGAMYRGVCLFALRNGFIRNGVLDKQALIERLPEISLSFHKDPETGDQVLLLNDEDVSIPIRSFEISQSVSQVATIKEVRQKLVHQQQLLGQKGGIVMDGRDIGTVVFPNAELKLFLTASIEVRTQRRFDEMFNKGQEVAFETVQQNLLDRDRIDSTREESPLRQAEDAIVIDNSELTRDEQLQHVLELVKETIHQQLA